MGASQGRSQAEDPRPSVQTVSDESMRASLRMDTGLETSKQAGHCHLCMVVQSSQNRLGRCRAASYIQCQLCTRAVLVQ